MKHSHNRSKRVDSLNATEQSSLHLHLCHVCHLLNESQFEIFECAKCQAVFTIEAPAAISRTIGMQQEWDEDFSEDLPEGFEEFADEMMETEEEVKSFHHNPLPFGRKKTPPLNGLKVHW